MRASSLGAVVAVALAGCSFSVNGVQSGASQDDGDLAMAVADLAVTDDMGSALADMVALGDMVTPPPPPPDMAMPRDLAPPVGLLMGTIAATGAGPIDLSAEGTADWAHWGTANKNSFDHRNIPTPLISDFTPVIGNETITQFGSYALGFSWNNGTPTATAMSTTTGVYASGTGTGFRITVPADTTTRTLRLYSGGEQSTVTVTAHLSDSSAADYTTATTAMNGDGTQFERITTLVYHATSAGQTLTVSWVQSSGTGFVHLRSATLQ